jgi:hypothetical protein
VWGSYITHSITEAFEKKLVKLAEEQKFRRANELLFIKKKLINPYLIILELKCIFNFKNVNVK